VLAVNEHGANHVLDVLDSGQTDVMSEPHPSPLAQLDLYVARLQELRDLAVNGVIDVELVRRASHDERGLACCWCGYDLAEHEDEPEGREGAIRHPFIAAGTKSIAWLLDLAGPRDPFPHNHARTPDVDAICVRCRIDASGTP
jgi:hypothetical protein